MKSSQAKALLEKYSSSLPQIYQVQNGGTKQGNFNELNAEYTKVCSSDKHLARLFNKSTKDVIKKREIEKKKEELIKQQLKSKPLQ